MGIGALIIAGIAACNQAPAKKTADTGTVYYRNLLFSETPGRLLLEVAPEHIEKVTAKGFTVIGETTGDKWLHIANVNTTLVDAAIPELKALWKNGLVPYY